MGCLSDRQSSINLIFPLSLRSPRGLLLEDWVAGSHCSCVWLRAFGQKSFDGMCVKGSMVEHQLQCSRGLSAPDTYQQLSHEHTE